MGDVNCVKKNMVLLSDTQTRVSKSVLKLDPGGLTRTPKFWCVVPRRLTFTLRMKRVRIGSEVFTETSI